MENVGPMFESHIKMGLNVEITEEEIKELIKEVGNKVNQESAKTANKIFQNVINDLQK